MKINLRLNLALALTLLAGAGCASPRTVSHEAGTIVDARTGKVVTFENMIDDLAGVPMVFVGESHNNPEHHLLEQQIVTELSYHRPHLQLGMEMFQRPMQRPLDRWNRGELDEETFLREADWFHQWGFDWSLYRGVFLAARESNVRVVAINIDREVTRSISRTGLEGLPGWLRARMPEEVDLSDEAHRASIRSIFDSHPGMAMTDERFERFYQSQCTWDETMAESAVVALGADPRPNPAILVMAGSMHVKGFYAIPKRAHRRNGLPYLTVVPVEIRGGVLPKVPVGTGRQADFIVFTNGAPMKAPLRFGITMRGGDTMLTKVHEGYPAHNAGLREGDALVSLDGKPVRDLVDLRLALDGVASGATLQAVYMRDGEEQKASLVMTPPPPPKQP